MKSYVFFRWVVVTVVVLFATACGKKDEAQSGDQIAARVNNDSIPISRISHVLSRVQNLEPEAAEKAKGEILGKLVEQQLAKQQAITSGLDRAPEVVQAIEVARDEILARAYFDKVAKAEAKATVEEAKQYYADHPELFAARRIYDLEELVTRPEGVAAALRARVESGLSLQEIAVWLQSQDIKFSLNRGVRAAEALPLDLLHGLQSLKVGGVLMMSSAEGRHNLFHVVASEIAPVKEEAAIAIIRQFLDNQKVTKAIEKEIKALKDRSDISYVGEYATIAKTGSANAKREPGEGAQAVVFPKSSNQN